MHENQNVDIFSFVRPRMKRSLLDLEKENGHNPLTLCAVTPALCAAETPSTRFTYQLCIMYNSQLFARQMQRHVCYKGLLETPILRTVI